MHVHTSANPYSPSCYLRAVCSLAELQEMTRRKLQDYAERYICAKHYQSLMTRAIASVEEHETADLNLQRRIRSLHWVSALQLEAPLHVERGDVRAAVESGITCTLKLPTLPEAIGKFSLLN